MPATTTRNTIQRQWELLHLLPPKGPGETAGALVKKLAAHGYKVSKRQVERDLGELYEALKHTITCNNGGVPYGWHWTPGAPTQFPDLTVAEALSLNVVESMVRPLLPKSVLAALNPRFRQAATKLNAMQASNPVARWTRKVRTATPTLPLLPPAIDTVVLETLQEALLADEQVQAQYRAADAAAPKDQRLHPLALVQRGPVTYLIATAFDYTQPYIYAVHRFIRVDRVAEPVVVPAGFDIDHYLAAGAMQFGAGGTVKLKAEVSNALAKILAETPLSEDQELTVDGEQHIVTATVPNSQQLRYWLLSQGSGIEVREPATLRDMLCAEIEAMARRYAERPITPRSTQEAGIQSAQQEETR